MIRTEHLASLAPPWVLLSSCDPQSLQADVHRECPTVVFLTVRGESCGTSEALFDEFARALEFPDYFGHNWDAFDECINDLEWLDGTGHVVAVTNAERLLADDQLEYAKFVDVLSNAGSEWAAPPDQRPSRPFHVVLMVSSQEHVQGRDWRLPQTSFDCASR